MKMVAQIICSLSTRVRLIEVDLGCDRGRVGSAPVTSGIGERYPFANEKVLIGFTGANLVVIWSAGFSKPKGSMTELTLDKEGNPKTDSARGCVRTLGVPHFTCNHHIPDGMSKYAPHGGRSTQARATSSTICQKCLGRGMHPHFPRPRLTRK